MDSFSREVWATFIGTLAAILVGGATFTVYFEWRSATQAAKAEQYMLPR